MTSNAQIIDNPSIHWWEMRYWQIVIAILLLLALTIPIPLLLNNVASTIVLTWTSILASVGGTWYFASETFSRNQFISQKEKALIAIRRPMEIARAVQRVLKNISHKKETISKFESSELSQNKKFLIEVFEGIELHVSELFGHLNYAIADWNDILGEDLALADETYEKINDLFQVGERAIQELQASYEMRIKEADSRGEGELRKVREELNKEIALKEMEVAERVKKAYENGKLESALSDRSGGLLGALIARRQELEAEQKNKARLESLLNAIRDHTKVI